MNKNIAAGSAFIRSLRLILGLLIVGLFSTLSMSAAHSAWFERLIPQGETHTVIEVDRDVAFLIDGFIYDARKFCYLTVGDRVVFLNGRHGMDYRATIYNLDSREHCELLLRGRLY